MDLEQRFSARFHMSCYLKCHANMLLLLLRNAERWCA